MSIKSEVLFLAESIAWTRWQTITAFARTRGAVVHEGADGTFFLRTNPEPYYCTLVRAEDGWRFAVMADTDDAA